MNAPNAPKRTPEEIAEEERLRQQYMELQVQVERDSRAHLSQIDGHLKHNSERIAYYDRMIAQLDPFIAEIEAGPPAPDDDHLLEKLRASRDLYHATKAMVEIQSQDYQKNQALLRSGATGSVAPDARFMDSTHTKPYLLAKAEIETSDARLILVQVRDAILILRRAADPRFPLPPEVSVDARKVERISRLVKDSPEVMPAISLALSHYDDALKLVKEARRTLKGVREYEWEAALLHGNTSVFYKLRGKMYYLERLAEQFEPYPDLAALFPPKPPEPPSMPFKTAAPAARNGSSSTPARTTRPLGQQTRRLVQDGTIFNDRG